MRFINFKITGYKAIKETEIPISHSLRPIIGINESGKTTILQAILAFDKNSDKIGGRQHLDYKDRYNNQQGKQADITASILFESEDEVDGVIADLGIDTGNLIGKQLKEKFESEEPVLLNRNFSDTGKEYSVQNINTDNKTINKKIAELLYKKLPYILYFDDFSDRVPEKIEFKIDADGSYSSIKINKSEEWHKLVEEMFKRKGYSINRYLNAQDDNEREGIINDVQDLLNEDIIKDWKDLISKYGPDLGNESSDLEITLKANTKESILSFEFRIKDRARTDARMFNITERSKGFQWFFNFITKLKYNHKYFENSKGAIYLLDEPGSYLHTSAQGELLKKLAEISKTNTILFCTHSQFLLDPNIISVGKIIVAEKEEGAIKAIPLKETSFSEENGALAPLYEALHTSVPYIKNSQEKQVITEGIVEYYFLKLVQKHTSLIGKDLVIIPGAGATQLSSLISYAIAFSSDYRVLLDSDKESRDAYDTYAKQFGSEEKNKFFKYKTTSQDENVQFEDHFSEEDSNKLMQLTGLDNVKSSLIALYFSVEEKLQKDFIENIDNTTTNNLNILFGVINNIS